MKWMVRTKRFLLNRMNQGATYAITQRTAQETWSCPVTTTGIKRKVIAVRTAHPTMLGFANFYAGARGYYYAKEAETEAGSVEDEDGDAASEVEASSGPDCQPDDCWLLLRVHDVLFAYLCGYYI